MQRLPCAHSFGVCAIMLMLLSGSLQASERVEKFSVLIGGVRVGHLHAEVDGSRIAIDYDYKNNGRGPTIKESITLDSGGLPIAWRIDGSSTFGSKITERFSAQDGKITWSDAAGADEATAGHRMYAAQSSSPWALGLYARALLEDGQSDMSAYPNGHISLEVGDEVVLTGAGGAHSARTFSLGGLDLNPRHILLDADRQLVAYITPRFVVVREGFEHEETRLRALAAELSTRRLELVAAQTALRFSQPVRISPVRIFDPHALSLSAPSAVVIQGRSISSVQPADAPASPGEVQIDGGGGTLVAGMFEMHGHTSQEQGPLNLAAGITSVRDMGNANDVLDGLIERVEQGRILGPRIIRSGFIEGKSEFSSNNGILVDSQQAALDAVRWYAARGYWQVKLYNSMHPEWAAATVAEARRLGLRVSGHVPAFGHADGMLDAGFDELTHINQLMLGWVLLPEEDTRSLLRFTAMRRFPELELASPAVTQTLDRFVARGVAMEPTIAIHENAMLLRDGAVPIGAASWLDHMPIGYQRDARQSWLEIATPDDDLAYRQAFDKIMDTLRLMHARGILLIPGTDLGGSFFYHRELELFGQLGMSPAEVIRRATWDMARYLSQEQSLGSIEPRKLADFFLVDGDPTRDLGVLKRIRLVVKDGVLHRPADIHALYGIQPFAEPVDIPQPTKQGSTH